MTETDSDIDIAGQDVFIILHDWIPLRILLTAGQNAVDDFLVEGLQHRTIWIWVGINLFVFEHEWKCPPFITTL